MMSQLTMIVRITKPMLVAALPRNLRTISCNIRCLQTGPIRCSVPKRTNKIHKRTSISRTEADFDISSITSYNLSEELRIDNAQKLLENFKEYKIVDLDDDLQDEAVMLSLNTTDTMASKTLHDIFLFRDGAIVFWGVPVDQQKRILYALSPLKIDPYTNDLIQGEKENISYTLEHGIDKSRLLRDIVQIDVNQDLCSLRLDLFTVSHAMALSVKLGVWEAILDRYIESIGWVTESMKKGQDVQLTRKQVFKKTGEIYELKHRINLGSDLLDLPDIYWDRHSQEVLFLALTSFLNIRKRTSVINEKLNNCCELMNLLSSHMNDKHHVRLEWMIIVLIMVEVLFEFVKLF